MAFGKKLRLCACSVGAITFLVACSGSDRSAALLTGSNDPHVASLALAAANDPVAPRAQCDGVLLKPSGISLENIGRKLLLYPCVSASAGTDATPGAGASHVWVDAMSGAVVDFESLRRADWLAFKQVNHTISSDLRETLAAGTDSDLFEAAVWFAVDESDIPPKDVVVASPDEGPKAEQLLIDHISTAALNLVGRIQTFVQSDATFQATSMISATEATTRFSAPFVSIRAPRRLLETIGDLSDVTLIQPAIGATPDLSSAYYTETVQNVVEDTYGDTGSGVTVAMVECGRPDHWVNLPGQPLWTSSESTAFKCFDSDGNPARFCHCAGANQDTHSRWTTGIVRTSSTTFGGMARGATTLNANFHCQPNDPPCQDLGFADSLTDGVEWALQNGARVLNQSHGGTVGNPASNEDNYDDYKAAHSPYPLFVSASGDNGLGSRVLHNTYNGLVVGGTNHTGNRHTESMYDIASNNGSNAQNAPWNGLGYEGMELPHVAAPAEFVDTASPTSGGAPDNPCCGTSLSAPILSGMAATVMQFNPMVIPDPEVLISGFMVGANTNVDGTYGGVWPLNVADQWDDLDGAGLVNGWATLFALSGSPKVGGDTVASYGWGDFAVNTSNWPAGTYYSKIFNAQAANGETLRAMALLVAVPACGSPPSIETCVGVTESPIVTLYILNSSGTVVGSSVVVPSNYQFAYVKNTTGSTQSYTIKVYMNSWDNVSGTYMGLAWLSGTQDN